MNKRVVAILFGGVSSEHEVSRMSATSVLKNIDREAFDPVMVGITKDGRWHRSSPVSGSSTRTTGPASSRRTGASTGWCSSGTRGPKRCAWTQSFR